MPLSDLVGTWIRTPGGLARILADSPGYRHRQYFRPIPECDNGHLEGDGGSSGSIRGEKVANPPTWKLCDHCGEEGYFLGG